VLRLLDALLWRCPPRPVLLSWWRSRRGRFVQRVRVGRGITRVPAADARLVLGHVDVSRISAFRDVTPQACAATLVEAFGLSASFAAPDPDAYRLDLAITEMRPMAWWFAYEVQVGWEPRWLTWVFFGTLGLGHAWLQVEGTLVARNSPKPILQFVHRMRWPNVTTREGLGAVAQTLLLGADIGDPDPIRYLCNKTAYAVLQEIHATIAT